MPSPNTSATQDNFLDGVSCTSASTCTAVGDYYTGTNDQTLIEQWNGTTWSIVSSPNTSATQDNYLNGVSCTSASACTAVGDYYTGTSNQTLIEQWNGTTWSIVSSPNTSATQDNYLYGVSCTSASACTAVGDYYNGTDNQTLIEQWNGTTWSIVSSPNTSATQSNNLDGVSCTSASACTAVGNYYAGSNDQTLIEQWNGTTWSIVSSPNTSATQEQLPQWASRVPRPRPAPLSVTSTPAPTTRPLSSSGAGPPGRSSSSPNTSATQDNLFGGVSCTSAIGLHRRR